MSAQWNIEHAEALAYLSTLPDSHVDAVITDPPYSSGGMVRSDRTVSTKAKYVTSQNTRRDEIHDFTGDNRDQRSYAYWCALWMSEALRVTRPGGLFLVFTDWRQLPSTADAIQAGGWIWRGIVPWHKPNARPHAGRFTNACEYVAWGSHGPLPNEWSADVLPGFYQAHPPRQRDHIAQKPLEVMRELVKITPPGGTILDPFAGSGTTGVAALMEGRNFLGAERKAVFVDVARGRCETVEQGYRAYAGDQLTLSMEDA